MGEVFPPVGIGSSRGRIDACAALRDVRIEERVDVNGESECVFGEAAASLHAAEVEAGSVVCLHGTRVVGIKVIDEANLCNRIASAEKFLENFEQVVGNAAVADNLPVLHLALKGVVKYPHVAQFRAWDGATALVALPLHPLKHRIGHGRHRETFTLRLHWKTEKKKEKRKQESLRYGHREEHLR